MRIALFSDNFYPEIGGIQDSIACLATGLAARGHDVDFYVPRAGRRDFEIVHLPVRELDLGPRVTVHRLASIPIPSPTHQSRLTIPTGQRFRLVDTRRPDVIHTHGFFGAGLEALSVARKLGVPLVGTNHWALTEFARYYPVPQKTFERYSLKYVVWYFGHCRFVSAPSESTLTEMRQAGLSGRGGVVSNPIDTNTFRPAPEQKQALKKEFGLKGLTMVFAGRLAEEKKIHILIRALPLIRSAVPDIQLVLAGHGGFRKNLEELAKKLGVETAVAFTGTLSKSRLANLYQASDMFTIASTSETQSMVLLQGMAAGLPAVSVAWRALKEYVNDTNGFLAPPDDPAAFAEKVITLARDPALREKKAAGAHAFAQRFSTDAIAGRWLEIYREAAELP